MHLWLLTLDGYYLFLDFIRQCVNFPGLQTVHAGKLLLALRKRWQEWPQFYLKGFCWVYIPEWDRAVLRNRIFRNLYVYLVFVREVGYYLVVEVEALLE